MYEVPAVVPSELFAVKHFVDGVASKAFVAG